MDSGRDLRMNLSREGRRRLCERCNMPTAIRVRVPVPIRWLRFVGRPYKAYRCAACGYSFLVKKEPRVSAD